MTKTISAGAKALLATRQFFMADLYEFVLANGAGTLRYTDGDANITYLSNVYASGGGSPLIIREGERGHIHQKLGLDVDTLQFSMMPGSSQIVGVPFNVAVQNGAFDGAIFTLYRCVMPTYGDTSLGATKVFVGPVGKASPSGSITKFTVNSLTSILNISLPKNLFQPTCLNVLGDTACGINLATVGLYRINGTVGVGATTTSIPGTMAAAKPAGVYELGKLQVTSGTYNGLIRPIKTQTNGVGAAITLVLWNPLPAALPPGVTFQAIYGCNKILGDSNGCVKFSNRANFRGHPYVPAPETAG